MTIQQLALPRADDRPPHYPFSAIQAEEHAALHRWREAVDRDLDEGTPESWTLVQAASAEIDAIRRRMYKRGQPA